MMAYSAPESRRYWLSNEDMKRIRSADLGGVSRDVEVLIVEDE